MKVRLLFGASAAYACIQTETRTLDVRLAPSIPAGASLRQTAQEMRERAARLISTAELIERAEVLL